jgi:ERI1 exoribonuclease 3
VPIRAHIRVCVCVQSMVDNQMTFPQVYNDFCQWLHTNNFVTGRPGANSVFVTCGDWDLNSMLPEQCAYSNIPMRLVRDCTVLHAMCGRTDGHFEQWINLKKAYHQCTGRFPKGMMVMLNELNIAHTGRHHSGIDDCMNLVNIVQTLIRDRRHNFVITYIRQP